MICCSKAASNCSVGIVLPSKANICCSKVNGAPVVGITTVVGNTVVGIIVVGSAVVGAAVVGTVVVGAAVVGTVVVGTAVVGIAVAVIDDWQVVPVKPTSHTPTSTLNTLVSNTSSNTRKY